MLWRVILASKPSKGSENIPTKKTSISVFSRFIVQMTSLRGDVILVSAWITWEGNSGKKILFGGTLTKKELCYCWGFFCLLQEWEHPTDQTSVGIPSAERCKVESFLHLFSSQLLVQFGDVVVPLCLVAGPGHRGVQFVFLPEALDLELAAAVSAAVGEDGLRAGQTARLLVHHPHIPVETCGRQTQTSYCLQTSSYIHVCLI